MKPFLDLINIVPGWCYWLLALLALCIGCEIHGRHAVQKKWDADKAEISAQSKLAVNMAAVRNEDIKIRQTEDNERIAKEHANEINLIRANSKPERLRIPSNVCSRVTATTKAESTARSDPEPPAAILLPQQINDDLQSLMTEADTLLAGCRAAQEFIVSNGMAP